MDLFDLAARITLDSSEYEKGIDAAERSGLDLGDKLKSVLGAAAKVTTAAITTAGAGVGALVKQSVEAYANYEQLVGGVETLFGAGGKSLEEYAGGAANITEKIEKAYNGLQSAQTTVLKNAASAYKSAGLSMNEYMETVTGMAAALVGSLGGNTEAAAEYADMAIRDMSDNANKMGSSMQTIQNAYAGFAKGNYTMLDNLKLGYGGTKTEMERLILDAEKLNGEFKATRDENGDLAMSYAEIVDAIHIVQDEMGITGTTAREASQTISGSVAAAKSAWANLVTGVADENADLGALIDNFVESVGVAADNILPRVEKGLQGVGTLVSKTGPIIAKAAPTIVRDVVPPLINAASDVVKEISVQLPELAPPLLEAVLGTMVDIGLAVSDNAPELIVAFGRIITDAAAKIEENAPQAAAAMKDVALAMLRTVTENGPEVIKSGAAIIGDLAQGLAQATPELIPAAADALIAIADGLIDNADVLLDAGLELMVNLATGFAESAPRLIEKIPELIGKLISGIWEKREDIAEAGVKLIEAIGLGAFRSVGALLEGIVDAFSGSGEIADRLGEITSKMTPFEKALADVSPNLSNYGELVSNAGHSLSELDQAIEESEQKITEILKGAAQENRGLREEEIKELTEHNEKLRNLWNEKIGIYRDTQVAELRKIQLEANNISQEMAAQYLVDAQAALEEANKISDQWYTQDITQIENLRRTTQITDEEYASRLQKAKQDNEDRLSENKKYYQETVSAIQEGGRKWVEADKEAWSNVRKESMDNLTEAKDETESGLFAYMKAGEAVNSVYAADIEALNTETAKSFLQMLAAIKESGGEIDEESQAIAASILGAFDNLPGSLEKSGTEALRGLVSGMEDEFPGLENAGDMSAQEIVDALKKGLNLHDIGTDAASSLSGGLSSDKSTSAVSKGANSLIDKILSATKGLNASGQSSGENFGSGLASGMSSDSMYNKVYNAAAKIARAANNAVKNVLQIASPSKVAIGLGKFFGEGMELGIEAMIPDVEKATEEMARAMTDPIDGPELAYSAKIETEAGETNNGVLSQLLAALADLKDNIQITVMLDDGTLLTRIDTGLGTIAQRKGRGN